MALFFEINEARKVLGLEEAASEREIDAAYQKMALKAHPDRNAPEDRQDAERRMKDVNWAYRVLKEYCSRSECKYLFTEAAVAQAYPRDAYNMRWAEFMADDSHV
jgi:DnaJ-class molecular chaperone